MGYALWVVGCGLWIMGYGLWVMDYGLWIMGYGLWVMGCRLWVMGRGLWVIGLGDEHGHGLRAWVTGMGHGHGYRYRLCLHACHISIWGAPILPYYFGCDESLMGCCVIFLAISHAHGDPLSDQQLFVASRTGTAETLAKRGGCGNHASIYRSPRVPLSGLCHRRGRALLT